MNSRKMVLGMVACVALAASAANGWTQTRDVVEDMILYFQDLNRNTPKTPGVESKDKRVPDPQQMVPLIPSSNYGVYLDAAFNLVKVPSDPIFGATLTPVEDAFRAQVQIPPGKGLAVGAVDEGGPCAQVGVQPNDIILSLGEKPIAKVADLTEGLKALGEGSGELKVLRAGKTITLSVRPVYRVTMGMAQKEETEYFIGVSIDKIDELLKSHLNLKNNQCIIINEIIKDSPAEKTGLQKFDVITDIDGKPVEGTDQFREKIQKSKNTPLKLQILRGGKPSTIQITPVVRKKEMGKNEPVPKDHIKTWSLDLSYPLTLEQRGTPESSLRDPRTELRNSSLLMELQQREIQTRYELEKVKSALRALEEKTAQPKPK